jgi:hypothetical protein
MKIFNIFPMLLISFAAAAIVIFLDDKKTPLAFIGWTIFFVAIFSPATLFSKNSKFKCYFTRK